MTTRRFHFLLIPLFITTVLTGIASAQTQEHTLKLNFEASSPTDTAATSAYKAIWANEGQRIVKVMQELTGLQFQETEINVIVREGPSFSGFGSRPMRMRSSYPGPTKRATLIHELGHRLQLRLFHREEEDHPYLFLYLYDVWVALYGKDFADGQVAVESRRKGIYDYESAWKEALAMTPNERAAAWHAFVTERQ